MPNKFEKLGKIDYKALILAILAPACAAPQAGRDLSLINGPARAAIDQTIFCSGTASNNNFDLSCSQPVPEGINNQLVRVSQEIDTEFKNTNGAIHDRRHADFKMEPVQSAPENAATISKTRVFSPDYNESSNESLLSLVLMEFGGVVGSEVETRFKSDEDGRFIQYKLREMHDFSYVLKSYNIQRSDEGVTVTVEVIK